MGPGSRKAPRGGEPPLARPHFPQKGVGLSQTSHTWEVRLLKNYEVDPVITLPEAFAPITDRRKFQRQRLDIYDYGILSKLLQLT